ncbi:MAG: hypothetical protein ING29_06005 [Azospirillum sp.]|nr:hypothetical protein [Azospirillum sp.]
MSRLVRLLVLLVALTGGGTAFAADPPAAGTGAEKGKFVLPRMIVAAIQGDRVVRHYALLMRLELAKPADAKRIEENLVRLQNAFILDLNDVASVGDSFDQERAKRRLMSSAARILGDAHVVEDVVFERVLERRVQPN